MTAFIEFEHGDAWHSRVLVLRGVVLRAPLGLRYSEEDLAAEQGQRHFALVDGDEPIACVIGAAIDTKTCKLRQMAVAPGRQGEGLGRRLVTEVEAVLSGQGIERIELHARAEAIGFYEKLGYEAVGEEFFEVTIAHRAMVKRLAQEKTPG